MCQNSLDVPPPRIHIAFVISSLYCGGAEGLLVSLINNLDRELFEPYLYILHGGDLVSEIRPDIPIYKDLLKWAGNVQVLPKLLRLIRQDQPVILDAWGRDDGAFWGRLAAQIAKVPVILNSEHRGRYTALGEPKLMFYHLINRIFDPKTDGFTAVSKAQQDFFVDIGLPPNRIFTILNGIPLQQFCLSDMTRLSSRSALGLSAGDPVVGMVANFRSSVKRHDVLLRAIVELKKKHPTVKCVLVGDGPLRPSIEQLAIRLGVDKEVVFLGARTDIPYILSSLDVFVLSSDSESFSNAIVEAMAAAKPVVTTNCGGPAEIVIDGETGIFVPVGAPSALAEKISFLLNNPELAKKMGLAGRERAMRYFSLNAMVTARQELFIKLCCKSSDISWLSQTSALI